MLAKTIQVLLSAILLLFLSPEVNAQTYSKIIGQPALNEGGLAVIASPDGNVFLGGFSSDSAMIIKMTPQGIIIWTRTFRPITGTNYIDAVLQFSVTPDNYLIGVGYGKRVSPYDLKGFYFKFDLNGNMQWCKYDTDTRPIFCQRILPKSATEYILMGDIGDQSASPYDDVITHRIDAATGNVNWQSSRINYMSGNPYIDDIASATFGNNNTVYSTGRIYVNGASQQGMRPYLSKFDNNGNILFSKFEVWSSAQSALVYGQDVIYDNDSLVITYRGSTVGTPLAYTNGLIKMDTLGNVIWSKDYDITGISPCEIADRVLRTPNGYMLIGYTNQFAAVTSKHLFVIATDINGNLLWSKIYGSSSLGQYDYYDSSHLAELIGNNVYITCTQDNGTNSDLYLLVMDLNGNIVCDPPVPATVVQSTNPTNSTSCVMNYPVSPVPYAAAPGTNPRTFPDQCSSYHLDLGNDTTLCSSVLLNATIPGATYQWQDGSTAPTYNVTGPGTYWVDAYINCCFLADTVIIQAGNFNASISSSTDVACYGKNTGSAFANPTGGNAPYSYMWQPSGGNAQSASGLSAGTYTCTITDANGCTSNPTVLITQPAMLTATSAFISSSNNGANGSATVTPSGGTPGYTYSWSPGGGVNPTDSALAAGSYTCTITDANGCSISVVVDISGTPEVDFYVPNAFTPNGDGKDDYFMPVGIGMDPDKFQIWIFDRWGNLIFRSNDMMEGWDGKVQGHSQICQIDTYVWKIAATDLMGKDHNLIGKVSLIK